MSGCINMMSELVRRSNVSVKFPCCCRKHNTRDACMRVHIVHIAISQPFCACIPITFLHKKMHLGSHLHTSIPLWSLSSFLLFTRSLIPSTSQLAGCRHPSLFVSQLRVSRLQLSFLCFCLLKLRLVHSSELPSSEVLKLALSKLPYSLWVSLWLRGAACHW